MVKNNRNENYFCCILGSIHDQPKETLKEQKIYNKLKALNHYHKKNGIDAIMSKKCTELRAKVKIMKTYVYEYLNNVFL